MEELLTLVVVVGLTAVTKTNFHYGASKAALEALTMAFAKIGAPHNVLINTIRPGATETPGHIQRYPDKTQ